jgi:two-component system, chemotaxis family, sensor kinase CheA
MYEINGQPVPVVSLARVLGLANGRPGITGGYALVLGAGSQRVAFAVDEVHGDQEVLIKNLGKSLARVPNVVGATVLGTGRVAPILNVHDLLKSAARVGAMPLVEEATRERGAERQQTILVAEDSITARGLLKNMLEAAGYRVRTAADGVEAWSILKLEPVDLVVSDVEMPRMSGFDLTSRIRADRQLGELPVVLVTALQSPEDRERGVDAGANAYIAKSGFDQSHLLEVVGRLI